MTALGGHFDPPWEIEGMTLYGKRAHTREVKQGQLHQKGPYFRLPEKCQNVLSGAVILYRISVRSCCHTRRSLKYLHCGKTIHSSAVHEMSSTGSSHGNNQLILFRSRCGEYFIYLSVPHNTEFCIKEFLPQEGTHQQSYSCKFKPHFCCNCSHSMGIFGCQI